MMTTTTTTRVDVDSDGSGRFVEIANVLIGGEDDGIILAVGGWEEHLVPP